MVAEKKNDILITANSLEFRLNALVGAINRGVDKLDNTLEDRLTDIADVLDDPASGQDLKPIFDLLVTLDNRLERIEQKMATQEERLQAVGAALQNVQAGVDALQESLANLKANNPELENEISAIEGQVAALGADLAGAQEPPAEPTPEG